MAVDGSSDLRHAEHKHEIEEELNETCAAVFRHFKNSSRAAGHSTDQGRTAHPERNRCTHIRLGAMMWVVWHAPVGR